MSLGITATTGRWVHNNSSLDDLTTFTWILWMYQTSTSGAQTFIGKATDTDPGRKSFERRFGDVDDYNFLVQRTGTDGQALTTGVARPLNDWHFTVATWDASDVPKIYFANGLSTVAVEASYSTQVGGTGGSTDGTVDLVVGNRTQLDEGFQGRIGHFHSLNATLTLVQIIEQQFRPHVISSTLVFTYPGFNGTTNVPDWSGNGITGTIGGSGVAVADHVPLGPPFGLDIGLPFPTVAAAGPTVPDQTLAPTQSQMNSGGMVGQTWMKRNRVYVPEELHGK